MFKRVETLLKISRISSRFSHDNSWVIGTTVDTEASLYQVGIKLL